MLLLSRADAERLLDYDQLLDRLPAAFAALSAGRASVPPRVAARAPEGMLAAMPGHLPGTGLAAKLVSVFPANHARGRPSHQALIALFDDTTGSPLALLDGTHITAARTGAASALSARLLATAEPRVLAILGAGVQGRSHMAAMGRVADFHEIRVASRDPEHARSLASTHPRARAMRSFEEAVRGAEVICCCTDAEEPLLEFGWLRPGAHLTSVGVHRELGPDTIAGARLFVESRVAFEAPPAGCVELQGLDPRSATELGEVIAGEMPGRASADEITVYKSMGHAVEDAVAARLVYEAALRAGAGLTVAI